MCSATNLLKVGGLAQCEQQCSDYMCCFKSGAQACSSGVASKCSAHKDCEILTQSVVIGTGIDGVAMFDYAKTCSKEMINKLGIDVCDTICDSVRFIFKNM